MTDDYTPTTEEVREAAHNKAFFPLFRDVTEFDRWLAAHDAAKRAEWEREQGWEWGCRSGSHSRFAAAVHWWQDEPTWREHLAECPSPAPVRRRTPGPWEPVDTTGSAEQ